MLFMHLEVFVNSSEGLHTERNKARCVPHNFRGSSNIKVGEQPAIDPSFKGHEIIMGCG